MAIESPTKLLQLRITLEHIEPSIWRRVVVADSLTFKQLHDVIQRAMGWEDCHMHEFLIGKVRIGTASKEDSLFGMEHEPMLSESRATLDAGLAGKKKFRYWYDFGDDWWHEIVVEKRLPAEPGAPAAQLIAGERACPPEDCGGPYGYMDLLEALRDPKHREHDELREWAGDLDPERFDLQANGKAVAKAARPPASRRRRAEPGT